MAWWCSKILSTHTHTHNEIGGCRIDFGMGIYHFALSVVPRHFQWLVEGVGFKGDRALAMREIEFVMNSPDGVRGMCSLY
jgi:hypothetical protein